MKIDLYLQGLPVEINQDIDFVLNKQYTDLTDLTSIIVDYSKTIKIPMTPKNNELFNYVYKLEHQVFAGEDMVIYNPSQKIPMVMKYNESTVMEGYAILNNVNIKEKTYEINLYGQLGKIFSILKDLKLKDYQNPGNGWSKPISMNTKTIKNSFDNDNHSLSWSSNDWTDFFGFAPQLIGDTDKLDTKNYEERKALSSRCQIQNLAKLIENVRVSTDPDHDVGEYYIGDGLDVNQFCEMRTYLTRPYVYVDKLIQMVQHEINSGGQYGVAYDGYTLDLDEDWFNSDNPYYKDMVFFPGNESIVDNGEDSNGFVEWASTERTMYFPYSFVPTRISTDEDMPGYTYSTGGDYVYNISVTKTGSPETTATLSLDCSNIIVRDRINGVGSTSGFNSDGRWAFYNLPNSNIVPIRYIGIYDGDGQLIYKLYLCDDTIHHVHKDTGFLQYDWGHTTYSSVWSRIQSISSKNIVPNSCKWVNGSSSNNYCQVTQYYNFGNVVLNTNVFNLKVECDLIDLSMKKIDTANITTSQYHTLCPFKNDKYKTEVWNNGASWESHFTAMTHMDISTSVYRSLSTWTINDILGNDFTLFTWLIDYAKKFRLLFDIDYLTKKITLTSRYFNDITYKNVVVDYSKGFTVEPVVEKYNKITFGYKDNSSKKSIKYMKNNGVPYGDMSISTGMELNNDILSLNPNEDESVFIPTRLNSTTWSNLHSNNAITYTNPLYTNKFINTLDKDNKIEYYPFFAFRIGNYTHSSNFWALSDDTPNQKNSGAYCYLGDSTTSSQTWNNQVETTQDGQSVYYRLPLSIIPQFDNFIKKTVNTRNTSIIPRYVSENDGDPVYDQEDNPDDVMEVEYTDPATGSRRRVRRSGSYSVNLLGEEESQTYLFWVSFGVPKEVYNDYLPSNIENYSIYNRWNKYLNEIFNIHNKKVTCYVRMTYPDFINFKFNQLFVIDNCTFLVNKIIDFNPNSTAPTKVELIQISDVENLK